MEEEKEKKRITNDPRTVLDESPIAQIFKVQYEYQKRVFEDYMKYLRMLIGNVGAYTPGTIIAPKKALELEAAAAAGSTVEMSAEVENRQLAYCTVSPTITPFTTVSGITWFPMAEFSPGLVLLAPQEVKQISMKIKLPTELSPGLYHGLLLLIGFRHDGIPVKIEVQPKKPTALLVRKPTEVEVEKPTSPRRTAKRTSTKLKTRKPRTKRKITRRKTTKEETI
ncbi:MAG: hypothetical protein ACFFB3_12355 [Candidatus Hodarchaeota archaeon]